MIENPLPRGPIDGQGTAAGLDRAESTGRYIVVFADTDTDPAPLLASAAGLSNVANSREFRYQAADLAETSSADATVFASLGMAVVSAGSEQVAALRAAPQAQGAVIAVVPELVHHIMTDPSHTYAAGYRDGVTDLTRRLIGGDGSPAPGEPGFDNTAQYTWGLQAVQVPSSTYTGDGIKVAVLDTGFDAAHPDFAGRTVTTESFVAGESAQDGHGHGTHCIGTACGSQSPSAGPRYGVASGAEIFAGKVLGDNGSGSDGGILAGIDWAVTAGCAVISMSLGADVAQEHPPYTAAGRRALDAGSLIIAAAGNNADRREGNFGFVGVPANSPEIMAVAALDQQLDVAYFSARSIPARGGQVDIGGPGWQVYSSWLMPERYRTISGTSMATPHAAGVAALWAEATGYRGRELWATMVQESQRLLAPSVDVGSGLVIAPQEQR